MTSLSKILAGTAIGAGIITGLSYFSNMRRAQVHLEIIPKANIHSLSLTGLTIRVDALLKNPTKAKFKIKFPYIRITYKDTLLGSSQVIDKDISIPAYGEVVIDSIMVVVPPISFLSVAYSVIKALNAKEPVTIVGKTITTVDLGWSRIPFESTASIVLKK